ncbi:unnamed protein product [Candida verbasci]|uniref:glutathione transferase n=1 Tax=Candida verbasci TaxID=1227364 RepID=A0A9W4TVN6_9ASCO|nr:unnamed protein product [Candida verbasci]
MTKKLILHWLNYSRSQRVVVLLEKLKVPYEIKVYERTKEFRAPKELEKIHPLGKSPVLEVIDESTNESQIITETGHIFNYLLKNFDKDHILTPTDAKQQDEVDYFLHYSEGTLQPLLVSLLVHGFAKTKAPFGTRFLMGLLVKGIDDQFYLPELFKNLSYLEEILKNQHEKGSSYFVGSQLTGADIILSFPLIVNLVENKRLDAFGTSDLEFAKRYPNIKKWAEFIVKLPDYVKAEEKVAKNKPITPNI